MPNRLTITARASSAPKMATSWSMPAVRSVIQRGRRGQLGVRVAADDLSRGPGPADFCAEIIVTNGFVVCEGRS